MWKIVMCMKIFAVANCRAGTLGNSVMFNKQNAQCCTVVCWKEERNGSMRDQLSCGMTPLCDLSHCLKKISTPRSHRHFSVCGKERSKSSCVRSSQPPKDCDRDSSSYLGVQFSPSRSWLSCRCSFPAMTSRFGPTDKS